MTGDETKHTDQDKSKCSCDSCHPLASNTGKEWLGRLLPIEWFQTLRDGNLCCQPCEHTALVHARELYEEAHKRIAELEKQCNEWIARAESKDWRDEKIAELEQKLNEKLFVRIGKKIEVRDALTKNDFVRFQKEKIASLESSLEGMKKHLSEEKEISRVRLSVMDELEAKLKTAEDKLAAVTKEKQDIQNQIKRNNDAQINKNLDDYYKPPTWKHS